MKCIFVGILFLLMLRFTVYSQDNSKDRGWIIGPTVSYQYQKHNMLKVSFWGLTDLNFSDYLKIDAGANFIWPNSKLCVIPEVGLTYYFNSIITWPYLKVEVTPYTVSPKVGVGLFNIVEFGAGYGWSLQERKKGGEIDGFNVSLSASLPLSYFF